MDLETLKIDLKGLEEGVNHLEFDLDDTYFKAVDAPEVSQGSVHVSLDIVRTGNDIFTLDFQSDFNRRFSNTLKILKIITYFIFRKLTF